MEKVKSIFKKYGFVFSFLFTVGIIALFHFTRLKGLKIYPVAMNFAIFWLFFSSLFTEETIIQKFARLSEGKLSEPVKIYTKNLTYIWCVFLFLQFLCSVVTCVLSDTIWMIYNGFLSYVLLGTFFAVEYAVRIVFRKMNKL